MLQNKISMFYNLILIISSFTLWGNLICPQSLIEGGRVSIDVWRRYRSIDVRRQVFISKRKSGVDFLLLYLEPYRISSHSLIQGLVLGFGYFRSCFAAILTFPLALSRRDVFRSFFDAKIRKFCSG